MEIITTLIGAFLGGSGSFLGKWMSSWIEIQSKKQDFDHEIQLIKLQMQSKEFETEHEKHIAQTQQFTDMRTASYEHDIAVGKTSLWVSNILRLVRPVLTLLLIALVAGLWLSYKENPEIEMKITNGVLFLTSTALTWWFGDRAKQ